jgi:flagellar basal-body rod protein FlgF
LATELLPATAATLDVSTRAMRLDMDRVRAAANNLANVNTAGFRREIVTGNTFSAALAAALQPDEATPLATIDSRAGPLRATGRALDLALPGAGYLEVTTDQGIAFTRNGALQVDAQGRLVTSAGHPVMGDSGEIRVDGEDVQILPNGDVRQGDRTLGRLRVVQFDGANPGLAPLGNGLYAASAAAQPAESTTGNLLRSGYLEQSNVVIATEMLRLTETMRHFEALQRIVQGYDESLEKAIRKFGEL